MANNKINRKLKIFTAIALIIACMLSILGIYAYTNGKGIENNVLRFHVIANSDSLEDQQLKLKLRDEVINYLKNRTINLNTKEEFQQFVKRDLQNLNTFLMNYLKTIDSPFTVQSQVVNIPFPTKQYGLIRIPEGNYDALRVIIGKGEGRNWWCVLFPPLCFADATSTRPEAIENEIEADKVLKAKLSQEEYALVTSAKTSEVPVKVKFKIVEMFQDTKIKLSMVKNRPY